MRFRDYFRVLRDVERSVLADECETSIAHLRNIAFSGKSCGLMLAADIERASKGTVTRRDLRPDDWHRIWPELITADHPAPAAELEARDAA